MDQTQLIKKRNATLALLKEIRDGGKAEKRKLSSVEKRSFDDAVSALKDIDLQLKNKSIIPPLTPRNMTPKSSFSLLKAIRSAVDGTQHDELTQAIINAGREEMRRSNLPYSGSIQLPMESRAIIASLAANSGQEAIAEDKLSFIEPLRAALVLVQAGANFMTGLTGDISMPKYAGTNALWKGETAAAVDGAGATSEVNLSPKRLTTYIDISKMWLAQDSINAEAMLMQDIVTAVSQKLESTILGKEAGSSTQPAGFFYVAPTGTIGAASWENIVGMESAVAQANALAGSLAYITSPSARGILKTTPKETGQAIYLADGNNANGYPLLASSNVATGLQTGTDEYGIVFGNWADFVIGQWGAIDLTVDPFTQAVNGVVRVTVNAYFDAKARNDASFKTGSLK